MAPPDVGYRFKEVEHYLRRIERIFKRLMAGKYENASSLWTIQLDLLALQREIQAEISSVKANFDGRDRKHERLRLLRHARASARRLGDTFAWLVLGADRQLIFPLAENSHVPVSTEGHGSRGVDIVAAHLAHSGWGFPLLHDLTDILRIGDVTFVKPKDGKIVTKTIEVKTRMVAQKAANDGWIEYKYDVTAVMPGPLESSSLVPPAAASIGPVSDGSTKPSGVPRPLDERASRQIRRMSRAFARQSAKGGEVFEVDGEKMLAVNSESNAPSHWKVLRRVIRNSRMAGYASESVENTFMYGAFYDGDGLTSEIATAAATLPKDLVNSGILIPDGGSRNSILVNSMPPPDSKGPQLFLPYFLYAIPRRAVADLLYGRLAIFILTNPGRIVMAIEDAGFEVSVPSGKRNDLTASSLVVSYRFVGGDGIGRVAEIHNAASSALEMIYEFKGSRYLVDTIDAIGKAAVAQITKMSDG